MKKQFLLLLVALVTACPALANHPLHHHVRLNVIEAPPLEAGTEARVMIALNFTRNGKPVTMDDLKEMHESKIHLLLVDPSLTDYQHIHPVPEGEPGHYAFTFTPHAHGDYRLWADITPLAAQAHEEYLHADLKGITPGAPVDTTASNRAEAGGLTFVLLFDPLPRAGEMAMGHVKVLQDGMEFTRLEPVMGAFSHIVAFPQDRTEVQHVHPLGEEPKGKAARGGPDLAFHFMPDKTGFTKLFVQVRVDGKDIFAPFGVIVQ